MKKGFLTGAIVFALFILIYAGATNYDRIVLGSGNYGTDPNTTADITLQNDEYISNYTDGTISFGAANLATTGTLTLGTNVAFIDSFTTTATADTHTVAGLTTAALCFAVPRGTNIDSADVMTAYPISGKVVVKRQSGGTSDQKYQVLIIR